MDGKYSIEEVAAFIWSTLCPQSNKQKVMLSVSRAWKEGAFKRIRNPHTEIDRIKYPFELDYNELDADKRCSVIRVNDVCVIQPIE